MQFNPGSSSASLRGCIWLAASIMLAITPSSTSFGQTPPANAHPDTFLDAAPETEPNGSWTLDGSHEGGSCCSRCTNWQIWGNVMAMSRSSAKGLSLVYDDPKGSEIFNSHDFDFGYTWGVHVGASRCLSCCSSLGVEFYALDGWHDEAQLDGNISVQFPSFPYLPELLDPSDPLSGYGVATLHYDSNLYNTEVNFYRRAGAASWLTMLAGFRWIELSEEFGALFETGGTTPNFAINTNNHLYGGQVGLMASTRTTGRWFLDTWVKAGIYANVADMATGEDFTSAGGEMTFVSAGETNTAFAGDLGVSVGRRLTDRLSVRLGYMALWIDDVALAPEQLDNVDPSSGIASLDSDGSVFYHGGFVGLEYLW